MTPWKEKTRTVTWTEGRVTKRQLLERKEAEYQERRTERGRASAGRATDLVKLIPKMARRRRHPISE